MNSILTKIEIEELYSNDDKFEAIVERGEASPFEADLIRKGKYYKPKAKFLPKKPKKKL